jgi:hypothetical protein
MSTTIKQPDGIRLYTYFRSSAAYRVRSALNLKGLPFESIPVHLLREDGPVDGLHKPDRLLALNRTTYLLPTICRIYLTLSPQFGKFKPCLPSRNSAQACVPGVRIWA